MAYYDNDSTKPETREGILLRVIEPTKLPTDQDVIASMVEYYKDGVDLSPKLRQTVKSQNTGNGNFDSWEF